MIGKRDNTEINNRLYNESMSIKELSTYQMTKYPAINIVGKRGSGKSCIVRELIQKLNYKNVIVISQTERMNNFYSEFIPKENIYYEYKPEIVESILRRQEKMIMKQRGGLVLEKDVELLFIMDDCLSQKGAWARDIPLSELLFNGRHYKIGYVLTMQSPLGLAPELRINLDYVFMLADDTISNLRRMYDYYAGMFPTFGLFKQTFTELTKNYGCMVIINRGAKTNIYEKICHYRAPDLNNEQIYNNNLFGNNDIQSLKSFKTQEYNQICGLEKEEIICKEDMEYNDCITEISVSGSKSESLNDYDKMLLLKVVGMLEKIVDKIYN